ncbi:14286_t:CDS:2 [Cetraspora pellucida]|uniref:14286_t:CDS:1 n=1 Tax=Cetraspora pellucida TaxID=1433469 RepID=A0ACA9LY30_9GLOM|nr:14286_t:CDS:2 [Cetraspora pellucida]
MSGYGNRGGDTYVESWCDPQTSEGWGGTQTNEGWGVLQLDEIGSLNAWIDNEEESWSGIISQEKESANQERTEVATTQGSQNSAGRSFITNDQQKPKSQNNFRNQYNKLKSHDNYQNHKTETHETRSKVLNANHNYIKANLQIITPETQAQVFDKRLLSSTLPPIVEESEYSNTSRWDDVNSTSFDDTVKPIIVQLSQTQISSQILEPPKNDSRVNDVSKVENMEKCKEVDKNFYTQCIELAKIEKSEEFLREDPQNKSKLNNDQLQSIEKKEQVIGAIKELEEIYKKIVNIDTEGKKNNKKSS